MKKDVNIVTFQKQEDKATQCLKIVNIFLYKDFIL